MKTVTLGESPNVAQATNKSLDTWIVLASLTLLSLLPSMSKFGLFGMTGDVESGSPASQLLWGLVYATAATRLVVLRADSVRLMKRSLPLVAFLVFIAISYVWSVDQWVTLRNAIEMIGTALVCYLVVVRFTLTEFVFLIVKYFAVVMLASFALVILWPSHGRSSYGVVGWCGLFSEKNGFGAASGLAVISFGVALTIGDRRKRTLMGLGLLLSCLCLIGSLAVTAATVTFAAIAIAVTAVLFSSPRFGVLSRFLLPVVVLALGIVVLASGLDSSAVFSAVGKSSTLTGRADFWPGVLRAIGDRPFLGFGYNAFFFTQSTVQEYIAGLTGWWIPLNAHNSYYQMILSVGFVGISIFAMSVLPASALSLVGVMRNRDLALCWPLAIIVFSLFGSFTEVYVGTPNSIGSMCFLIALLYPLRVQERSGADPVGAAVARPKHKTMLRSAQQVGLRSR